LYGVGLGWLGVVKARVKVVVRGFLISGGKIRLKSKEGSGAIPTT
jgi:hypothetical protein